jgi:hypothetical protein
MVAVHFEGGVVKVDGSGALRGQGRGGGVLQGQGQGSGMLRGRDQGRQVATAPTVSRAIEEQELLAVSKNC